MIERALVSFAASSEPEPSDVLRAGIIQCSIGDRDRGWKHIAQAILSDTRVEHADPAYGSALLEIVRTKYGTEEDLSAFLRKYRKQHARRVPSVPFRTADGQLVELDQQGGKALIVVFFSPQCGSCREEIPRLRPVHKEVSARSDAAIYYVLNRPELAVAADDLLSSVGIEDPLVVTAAEGSGYDLISAEPTTWIVDPNGAIRWWHTGYRQGDEVVYLQELEALLAE